jgi:formate dehydrogenase maturation protein FdhE
MSDPLSLINGAITIITSIKDHYKKIDQTRFEAVIAEMTKQLTDTRIEISALLQKNHDLEKEIQNLKKLADTPLTLKNGIYYDADGKTYCPACTSNPHGRIPMSVANQQGAWILYRCPKCNVRLPTGVPPSGTGRGKKWNPFDDC